ncbi:uncharacterized protein THITE_2113901 [Thermothielavioides terrestris NRRL 8126]|uniref:WLM domain-containing protein n=1 Tax=Thermothielavioides terrestris (strain ATCC 38088 / NRRL 8126) TaxID=578455 RepID=G2R4N9_THETT|nr:uncharacterized protein THITE_2113901 [Thermothielavioides terrestris NRRL 8126]AEO66079.1 hypothetical protein THITE_2113901 [Thermothielavioides terrestris NRRL 8126]
MSWERELNPLIHSYTHLSHFPREQEALHLLKRLASLVKPLMRARNWTVGTLAEMYPEDDPGLLGLNINKGEQILVRLRESSDRYQFRPFERLVNTMLHELTHIVFSGHDQWFHAFLDQLHEELDGLMAKGYTGEGFLGRGQRLGGRDIPYHEALRLARAEAASRRADLGFGGRMLGGVAPRPGQDLRSAILESVERRRAGSELGCANNNRADRELQAISQTWLRNGFRTKAEEDAANEAAMAQALWELVHEEKKRKNAERPTPPRPVSPELRSYWACNLCTLHNPIHAATCGACGNWRPRDLREREVIDLTESPPKKNKPKPGPSWRKPALPTPAPPRPTTWRCSFCSTEMESQWWTCSLCGKMKESS